MELTEEHRQTVDLTVRRLADIQSQIAELDQQAKALKHFLRNSLGYVSKVPIGRHRVSITKTVRFDPNKAEKVIPGDLLPLVTESRIVAAKAREVLPAELYEQCTTEYEPTVRIA